MFQSIFYIAIHTFLLLQHSNHIDKNFFLNYKNQVELGKKVEERKNIRRNMKCWYHSDSSKWLCSLSRINRTIGYETMKGRRERVAVVMQSTLIANSILLKWKQVRWTNVDRVSSSHIFAFKIAFFGLESVGTSVCECAQTKRDGATRAREEIAPGLSGLSILNNSFAGPRKYTAMLAAASWLQQYSVRRFWKDRRVPRGGSLPRLCLHNLHVYHYHSV